MSLLVAARSRARRAMVAEGVAVFRRAPVDPSLVVYESFAGNGMLCNPEAIYRVLRADPRFDHLRHVWVLDDPAKHPAVVAELAGDPRVSVVTRRSAAYFRALSTAGFLVNNATFPAEFAKREGQVYVNTWHGTPLKRMGYDLPNGAVGAANIVRNFLQADFLLSASPYMTEQLYARAYKMRGILPGRVLEEGYPRMDRQAIDRAAARAALAARGLDLGEGRVVLHAPTWRGTSFTDPEDDSAEVAAHVRRLRQQLGSRWTVLLKVHQAVFDRAARHPDLSGLLVHNDLPTNLVLAACDVLVADYSSLIVDFLALDRPVVLHTPDRSRYDEQRGLYEPAPGAPGPVLGDVDDVATAVAAVGTGSAEDPEVTHAAARRAWSALLCPHDDGAAGRRVVDAVFGGQRERYRVVDLADDGRQRILLYIGELRPNGMTNSALNLLRAIDHSRFDVTALCQPAAEPQAQAMLGAIHPAIRTLVRMGAFPGSTSVQVARQVVQRRGVGGRRADVPLARAFQAEWDRCVGQARFDSVADFIGYGPFWDLLLLQGPPAHRAIWLHNDMVADAHREVGGRRPLRRSLEAVFSTYRFFDSLVSVSPALREVNRASLSEYAAAERFTVATNVIDAEAVRARASAPPRWQPPAAPPGVRTFVAAGRLSSAKNFPRMVEAFAQVHREDPATRLVILGEGPERAAIEARVAGLGVGDAVFLPGHQDNPYPTMAASDCYVMSSDHEGQPMVLLEALVLGRPVVTTAFSSVASALPEGEGRVVARSVEGLAEGMRAFLAGEVPAPSFDAEAYNREALEQFYRAVGVESGAAAG